MAAQDDTRGDRVSGIPWFLERPYRSIDDELARREQRHRAATCLMPQITSSPPLPPGPVPLDRETQRLLDMKVASLQPGEHCSAYWTGESYQIRDGAGILVGFVPVDEIP